MGSPILSGSITVTKDDDKYTQVVGDTAVMEDSGGTISFHNTGPKAVYYVVLASNMETPGSPLLTDGKIRNADWGNIRRERPRWDDTQNAFVGAFNTMVAKNTTDIDRWKGKYRHIAVVAQLTTAGSTAVVEANIIRSVT